MAELTIRAVYHDGAFHPKNSTNVHFREGQEVDLNINETPEERVKRILDILAHFYDGLSEEEIEKIESGMRRRQDFFGREEAEGNDLDPDRAA